MSNHVNRRKLYATLEGKKSHYMVTMMDDKRAPRLISCNLTVTVGVHWLAENNPALFAKLMSDRLNGKRRQWKTVDDLGKKPSPYYTDDTEWRAE